MHHQAICEVNRWGCSSTVVSRNDETQTGCRLAHKIGYQPNAGKYFASLPTCTAAPVSDGGGRGTQALGPYDAQTSYEFLWAEPSNNISIQKEQPRSNHRKPKRKPIYQ